MWISTTSWDHLQYSDTLCSRTIEYSLRRSRNNSERTQCNGLHYYHPILSSFTKEWSCYCRHFGKSLAIGSTHALQQWENTIPTQSLLDEWSHALWWRQQWIHSFHSITLHLFGDQWRLQWRTLKVCYWHARWHFFDSVRWSEELPFWYPGKVSA